MGGCILGNILPINISKGHGGKIFVFRQETFKIVRTLLTETWFLRFRYGYC